jgi:hypothetical protein
MIEDINEEIEKENERITAESTGMVSVINFNESRPSNI